MARNPWPCGCAIKFGAQTDPATLQRFVFKAVPGCLSVGQAGAVKHMFPAHAGMKPTRTVPSSARSRATARFRIGASTSTVPGRCSPGAPGPRGPRCPSAITASGRRTSPLTSRPRRPVSRPPSFWQDTRRRGRRSSTIGARSGCLWTRLSASGCEGEVPCRFFFGTATLCSNPFRSPIKPRRVLWMFR